MIGCVIRSLAHQCRPSALMVYVEMIGGLLELDENGDEPTNAEVTPRDRPLRGLNHRRIKGSWTLWRLYNTKDVITRIY